MSEPQQIDIQGHVVTVKHPATQEELGQMVHAAAQAGQAIYPVGGGTRQYLGLPPVNPGIGLCTRKLDRVIDYPARDMTVTVELGMTVANLREVLAGENQDLPIDCPDPSRATLGGLLATNGSGSRRHGYGTLRDYLLGLTVIDDHGRPTKSGGRVVKNVAGYDMGKLHIGALGTLGPLVQATFKLKPRPEATALSLVPLAPDQLEAFANQMNQGQTRPIVIDLLSAGAAREFARLAGQTLPREGWHGLVGFDGAEMAVRWQLQTLRDELRSLAAGEVLELVSHAGAWEALTALGGPRGTTGLRAGVLPGESVGLARSLETWAPASGVVAHLGAGIINAWGDPDTSREPLLGQVERLRHQAQPKRLQDQAQPKGGWLVVTRSGPTARDARMVFGSARQDHPLMAEIKRQLDPGCLFNPGRYLTDL
jgi:glycolate oxidase FAD binding subunit